MSSLSSPQFIVEAAAGGPVQIGAAHLHRSRLIGSIPGVVHGITRRVAGAGRADGNVGYSAPRDRADAWAMRGQWLAVAGLDATTIAVASQVHGNDVCVVSRQDAGKGADPETRPAGTGDALIAATPGVVAMTLHADCMPILLCDPAKRVVATIHAGWRGTTADVAGSTVREMRERFGSDPADVLAYLGPAIGACCYEVGADVAEAWQRCECDGGNPLIPSADRWRFDLVAANRALLLRAGVQRSRIEESGICTRCNGDEWFSHRGQGPATGRYGAFIALAEH